MKLKVRSNKNHRGFTLLELVIVIAIIGILAGVAIVRLSDLTGSATVASEQGFAANVRTALLEYYAQNSTFPSVTSLNGYMVSIGGSSTTAVSGGVQVTINGTPFTVPTFSDDACTTQTSSVNSIVHCVGG